MTGAQTCSFIIVAAVGLVFFCAGGAGDRPLVSGSSVRHVETENYNPEHPHSLGTGADGSADSSRLALGFYTPQSEVESEQQGGKAPGHFERLLYSDVAEGVVISGEDPRFLVAVSAGPKALSDTETSAYMSSEVYSSDLEAPEQAVYFESPNLPSAPKEVVQQHYIGEPEDWRHGSLQSTFADNAVKQRPVSSTQMQRIKHSAMLLIEENRGVIDDSWAFGGEAKAGGEPPSVADPAYGISDSGTLGVFDDPHFVTPQE